MPDAEKFHQMIVRMPTDEHEALRRRAEAEDRTMAVVMRRAFREYDERAQMAPEGS